MKLQLLTASLLMTAAFALPAGAQDAAILVDGGPFVPIAPVFFVDQTDDVNVAGVVQTSDFADATVFQEGFYNRAVIVQSGLDPIGTIDQIGDFNRALILQLEGETDALIIQDGVRNTGITFQTGTVNVTAVTQNGEENDALTVQDETLVFDLTPDDLRTVASNFLYAPETARAAVEANELGGIAFTDAILGRLSDRNSFCSGEPQQFFVSKSDPQVVPIDCARLHVYANAGYSGGEQDDRLGAIGFEHDGGALLLGAEVPFTEQFLGGVAFRYARTETDLRDDLAEIETDSYGGAIYGDYRWGGLFVSALGFYSHDDVEIDRPGIASSTSADPEGETYGGAVRAGYLFDVGLVQAGPIVGYTYSRAELDGYSETGHFLLTQEVPDQDSRARMGLVGGRIAFEEEADGYRIRGFADLAYERDFESEDFEILRTEFTFAPDIDIWTPVDPIGDIDYFHLAGGLSVDIPNRTTVEVTARGRFSDERDSYGINAEVRKAF